MSQPEGASAGLRQRVFVVALFAVFMFPIFGALALNVLAPSWSPFGRVNRGELVEPPVRLGDQLLAFTERHVVPDAEREGTWMVVHVSEPPCNASCEQALVSLRQARLALGKDAFRVERWWMMTREADARTVQRVAAAYPGLKMTVLARPWPLARTDAPLQVVDPAGFVILSYDHADAASDLLKDLKRLLKISKQG